MFKHIGSWLRPLWFTFFKTNELIFDHQPPKKARQTTIQKPLFYPKRISQSIIFIAFVAIVLWKTRIFPRFSHGFSVPFLPWKNSSTAPEASAHVLAAAAALEDLRRSPSGFLARRTGRSAPRRTNEYWIVWMDEWWIILDELIN